jgi:predicted transcriptional regulator
MKRGQWSVQNSYRIQQRMQQVLVEMWDVGQYPSVVQLAELVACSRSTAYKHLAEMASKGWLKLDWVEWGARGVVPVRFPRR